MQSGGVAFRVNGQTDRGPDGAGHRLGFTSLLLLSPSQTTCAHFRGGGNSALVFGLSPAPVSGSSVSCLYREKGGTALLS